MPAYKGEHEDILRPFLDAMRFKLASNRHKGKSFEDMSYEDGFRRLREETAELEEAIKGGNQFEIIFEAADIANFALFIATKAIREAGRGAEDIIGVSSSKSSV